MISFDLECTKGHRFEGIFKDYDSFNEQLSKKIISCPICDDSKIKRLYTGCSIQSNTSENPTIKKENLNIFDIIKIIEDYVKNNYENVGREFANTARAIYYGIEEQKNIYGESTTEEVKDLQEEGIDVIPLPPIDKFEN